MVKENDKDLVAPLDIRTDGDTDFWRQLLELQGGLSTNLFLLRKHQHELHIIRPVLITSTNDYFMGNYMFYNCEWPYCICCHASMATARESRGRKGYVFKGFELVLVKQ
ncbi:hypothetical protein C1H46_012306 [Malus baccata]|uniref:Uncharacterized protein n=1 Tax=Malus baccata TaxID=106549 RepID=A0A540MTH3_MALBA|nr:hypothetical protein C1H46_012306 [Malus baccata]